MARNDMFVEVMHRGPKGHLRRFDPPRYMRVYEVAVRDDDRERGRARTPSEVGALFRSGGWMAETGEIRVEPTDSGVEGPLGDGTIVGHVVVDPPPRRRHRG